MVFNLVYALRPTPPRIEGINPSFMGRYGRPGMRGWPRRRRMSTDD
jgi:hypothetical protein